MKHRNLATAVTAALEKESARGGGYEWGVKDCTSLIRSLCTELGVPLPDYSPLEGADEARSTAITLRKYKTIGAAHQQRLCDTGAWSPHSPRYGLEPGRVVSLGGNVRTFDYGVYVPLRESLHWTGLVGADCRIYGWGMNTLTYVTAFGSLDYVTVPVE